MTRYRALLGILLLCALAIAPAAAQEPVTVSGAVTDSSGGVLPGVTVEAQRGLRVVATAATGNDGRYRLDLPEAGRYRVTARLDGFSAAADDVAAAAEAATADFRLDIAPVRDTVVVTASRTAEGAASVTESHSVFTAEDIETLGSHSVADVLRYVPGFNIESTGREGALASVFARGGESDYNHVLIDGVRVNDNGGYFDFDKVSAAEIDRVEVVRGAQSALYGSDAIGSVIQIFTKRGQQGAPRFEVSLRQGASFLYDAANKYPVVWGLDSNTGQLMSANLVELEAARGTPVFRTGLPTSVFASVSGGIQNLRYYFSADALRDEGMVDYQWQNKLAGRSNLSYTTERFEAGVNMGFIRQKTHTSGGEQAMTFQLMWGSPLKLDGPSRGFFRNSHEDYHNYVSGEEEIDRFTGGFYLRHSPAEWLTHRLDIGGDFGNQRSFSLWPRTPQQPGPFRRSIGQKDVVQDRTTLTTVSYNVTAPFDMSDDLRFETSSGVQYYQRKHQITLASGVEFPVPGVSTVSAAAQRLADEDFIENKTFGVYVQEQIGWKNRLFLTGAVRGDDNSAFGENFDFVVYPKVSTAWVVSEEPFWSIPLVNTLKLRAAWGKAGQQPDVFAATRLYAPATGRGGIPTLTPSNIGNPDLKPEVGQELELGFDASLFDQKVTIDFTYYDQKRKDAIVPAAALPSLGFPGTQFVNVGEVANKGFEIAVGTQVFRSEDWGLDLGGSYANTDNTVVDLGGNPTSDRAALAGPAARRGVSGGFHVYEEGGERPVGRGRRSRQRNV